MINRQFVQVRQIGRWTGCEWPGYLTPVFAYAQALDAARASLENFGEAFAAAF